MNALRTGLWLVLVGAQVSACSLLVEPSEVGEEDDDAVTDEGKGETKPEAGAPSEDETKGETQTDGAAPTDEAVTTEEVAEQETDEAEPPNMASEMDTLSEADAPTTDVPDEPTMEAMPSEGESDMTEPAPDSTDTSMPPVADGPFTIYTGWPYDADEAKRRQSETAEMLGLDVEFAVQLDDTTQMLFELIPAGEAVLGSDPALPNVEGDELQRDYVLERPFYLGKTQITQRHYEALFGEFPVNEDNAWFFNTESPEEPVLRNYRWRDELEPALQAKLPEGWIPRIPTPQEFEYATRSGTSTAFYFGDTEEDLARSAWYLGNADVLIQDVGQLEPNAWNLFDMQGNSWHFVFMATGDAGDTDPLFHLIMGCDIISPPFENGCRASNKQIADRPQAFRYILEFPLPE